MTQALTHRRFLPGTTGWTVDDLNDPDVRAQWSRGRYELVEGVLTLMAPQGYQGIRPLNRLRRIIEVHLNRTGQRGEFSHEVDLSLLRGRLARPDMVFLTEEQEIIRTSAFGGLEIPLDELWK